MPFRYKETHSTDEHLNASQRTVYASLNIPGGDVCGHGDNMEPAYSDPVLDTEKKSKNHGSISVEQPVYICLEKLSVVGLEGPVSDDENYTQPVCRVTSSMKLYLEASDGPGTMSPDEPVYNTLEQLFPDDVKEPNDSEFINDPIYYVLEEEPNPGVSTEDEGYGTRNLQDLDPVFNVLEGPDPE